MKAQYQIFDGLHYISIIKNAGKYIRLRNCDNRRYAITYDLETADRINNILNDKGIPSRVVPYIKDWKRKNETFIKTKINDNISNN